MQNWWNVPCLSPERMAIAMTDKTLRALAEEFVVYKQSIGYVYNTQCHYLMRYVRYAENLAPGMGIPDKRSVTGFLNTVSESPGSLHNATATLREFCHHLTARGLTEAYIVPPKSNPSVDPDPPYFFTAKEISGLFDSWDSVRPHPNYPGRELAIPALFRLMYCCGLRCKESRTLLHKNVCLNDCHIDVIQSKGPKNRRIFISTELSSYLKYYDESIQLLFPGRAHFFPRTVDSCYTAIFISNNFRRLWKLAFPEFVRTTRPRAYDLRHHFVWSNLNRWATEGIDVNAMLPYLARYMGHQDIRSTLYYFRFVPDFFPVFSDMSKALESVLPEVPYEA
jgi:integrase